MMNLFTLHQDKVMLNYLYKRKDLGKATVTIPEGQRYWLTHKSEELGANIIEVLGFSTNIQVKAKNYCLKHGHFDSIWWRSSDNH